MHGAFPRRCQMQTPSSEVHWDVEGPSMVWPCKHWQEDSLRTPILQVYYVSWGQRCGFKPQMGHVKQLCCRNATSYLWDLVHGRQAHTELPLHWDSRWLPRPHRAHNILRGTPRRGKRDSTPCPWMGEAVSRQETRRSHITYGAWPIFQPDRTKRLQRHYEQQFKEILRKRPSKT